MTIKNDNEQLLCSSNEFLEGAYFENNIDLNLLKENLNVVLQAVQTSNQKGTFCFYFWVLLYLFNNDVNEHVYVSLLSIYSKEFNKETFNSFLSSLNFLVSVESSFISDKQLSQSKKTNLLIKLVFFVKEKNFLLITGFTKHYLESDIRGLNEKILNSKSLQPLIDFLNEPPFKESINTAKKESQSTTEGSNMSFLGYIGPLSVVGAGLFGSYFNRTTLNYYYIHPFASATQSTSGVQGVAYNAPFAAMSMRGTRGPLSSTPLRAPAIGRRTLQPVAAYAANQTILSVFKLSLKTLLCPKGHSQAHFTFAYSRTKAVAYMIPSHDYRQRVCVPMTESAGELQGAFDDLLELAKRITPDFEPFFSFVDLEKATHIALGFQPYEEKLKPEIQKLVDQDLLYLYEQSTAEPSVKGSAEDENNFSIPKENLQVFFAKAKASSSQILAWVTTERAHLQPNLLRYLLGTSGPEREYDDSITFAATKKINTMTDSMNTGLMILKSHTSVPHFIQQRTQALLDGIDESSAKDFGFGDGTPSFIVDFWRNSLKQSLKLHGANEYNNVVEVLKNTTVGLDWEVSERISLPIFLVNRNIQAIEELNTALETAINTVNNQWVNYNKKDASTQAQTQEYQKAAATKIKKTQGKIKNVLELNQWLIQFICQETGYVYQSRGGTFADFGSYEGHIHNLIGKHVSTVQKVSSTLYHALSVTASKVRMDSDFYLPEVKESLTQLMDKFFPALNKSIASNSNFHPTEKTPKSLVAVLTIAESLNCTNLKQYRVKDEKGQIVDQSSIDDDSQFVSMVKSEPLAGHNLASAQPQVRQRGDAQSLVQPVYKTPARSPSVSPGSEAALEKAGKELKKLNIKKKDL